MKELGWVLLLIFIFNLQLYPVEEQIKEEITVSWWVLPMFALDNSGNSVQDLKREDIDLAINGKNTGSFILYKRDFSVDLEKQRPRKEEGVTAKARIIFLLFDLALTDRRCLEQSRIIAKKLVSRAAPSYRFVIMTLDPLRGLTYLAGPTNHKTFLLNLINKKVKFTGASGSFKRDYRQLANAMDLRKYEGDEFNSFVLPMLGNSYKNKTQRFFNSFGTFYYSINWLQGSKFVYLFTDGLTDQDAFMRRTELELHIKIIADYLNRSSAVLFIVNPAPDHIAGRPGSGEEMLRLLEKESGGRYVVGTGEKILTTLENVHRSYYEIAFPGEGDRERTTLDIKIKPRRPGIDIHTLKTMEKPKKYNQMKEIEKEVLVLNLIHRNPMANACVTGIEMDTQKIIDEKNRPCYRINIPGDFLGKEVDFYHILVNTKNGQPTIKKKELLLESATMDFPITQKKDRDHYMVMVYKNLDFALIKGANRKKVLKKEHVRNQDLGRR